MSYKISDACIHCDACTAQCPVSAISERNGKHIIEASTCVSCGSCAGVCPANAISEG